MEITTAVLCDFTQVREGLLFVASGGVTRVMRPGIGPGSPAPLGLMVAVVVELEPDEIELAHEVKVTITDVNARPLAQLTGGFQAGGQLEPGESLQVPMSIDARGVPLESYGPHDVRVSVDNNPARILRFYVIEPPSQPQSD